MNRLVVLRNAVTYSAFSFHFTRPEGKFIVRAVDLTPLVKDGQTSHLWFPYQDIYQAAGLTKCGSTETSYNAVPSPAHRRVEILKFPNSRTDSWRLLSGIGVYAFLKNKNTMYRNDLLNWLHDEVLPVLRQECGINPPSTPKARIIIPNARDLNVPDDDDDDDDIDWNTDPSFEGDVIIDNDPEEQELDLNYEGEIDLIGVEEELEYDDDDDCVPPPAPRSERQAIQPQMLKPKPVVARSAVSASTALVRIDENHQVVVDSLMIAEQFSRRHDNVLQTIKNLNCTQKFSALNFKEAEYKDAQGKNRPLVTMTRDGCVFLIAKLKGSEAGIFLERYIAAFNAMESKLQKPSMPLIPTSNLNSEIVTSIQSMADRQDKAMERQEQFQTGMVNAIQTMVNGVVQALSSQTQRFESLAKTLNDRLDSIEAKVDSPVIIKDSYTETYTEEDEEEFKQGKDRWRDDSDVKLDLVKAKSKSKTKQYTIVQYLRLRRYKLDINQRKQLAFKATALASERDIVLDFHTSHNWGKVNVYPEALLKEVYDELFGNCKQIPNLRLIK
jgi:Rha family phage regulatory protein